MKLFLLSIEPLDANDAQSTHVIELFTNFSNLTQAYLIAPKPKKNFQIQSKGNTIFIPTFSFPVLNHIIFNILSFFYLFYYCNKFRPDFFYTRHSIVFFSYLPISKIFGIPFILEVNGLAINQFKNNKFPRKAVSTLMVSILTKISEKINFSYASKIIVVTRGIKEYIEKNYCVNSNNVIVIENGANTDLFQPLNKYECREKLGLSQDFIYIGFSGSFSRWHGLVELVSSVPFVVRKVENTKFLLIGNGLMKKYLYKSIEKLNIQSYFIFINRISYKEVPIYLNTFDIGVILKDKNVPGSPLKLWEYMACGLPIIATKSEDFKVVKECNCGFLVDPNNPIEIEQVITKLCKDENLRKELGSNGRKYVLNNRSWKKVTYQIYKLLDDLFQIKDCNL